MTKIHPFVLGLLASVMACQNGRAESYTYTTLNLFSPYSATAESINNAGQVTGTVFATNNTSGFLYNSDGSYTTFSAFNAAPGVLNTAPSALNNVGQIVGSTLKNATVVTEGFLDTNGVFTPVNFPGGHSTVPRGINDAGEIVGTYFDGAGQIQGFTRSPAGVYTTFQGNAPLQAPISINDRGQLLVVTYTIPSGGFGISTSGFLDTNGSLIPLPVMAGVAPFAGAAPIAINNSGQVLYSASEVIDGFGSGVLDADGTYTPLSPPGDPYQSFGSGINDQGQVVGNGSRILFIATPTTVPEPRSLLLIAFGIFGIPIVRKLRVQERE